MNYRRTPLRRSFAALLVLSAGSGLNHAALAVAAPASAPTTAPPAAAAAYKFLDDQAEPMFNLTFTPDPAATGQLSVVFDYRDEKNYYALDMGPKTMALRSVIGGVSHALAGVATPLKAGSKVTLKRRPWLMQVIVDRRVALTAYDASFDTGKIGSSGSDGWAWKDARLQPIEEIYYSDDFTRADTQQNSDWKTSGGVWKLTAASPTVTVANRDMSANPFSYQVDASGSQAFAQTGRWFWDHYDAQVSVKPMAHGAVGLAVYVQDEKNYIGFLWRESDGPSARELVRVVDGNPTVLAHDAGSFLPRQWYRLGVRTSPGSIETFIDGQPVFKVPNNYFGQGGIALLAENTPAVNFDDAHVQSYPYYDLDFSTTAGSSAFSGGAWTPQHGVWRADNGMLLSASAPRENGSTRFILTGRNDWKSYTMTAAARAGKAGACGLVVGYQDEANYAVFRWAAAGSPLPFRGRQQLLRYRSGKARVLSDQPLDLDTGEDGFAVVKVDLAAGAFTVYNGDEIVAQMTDETLASGRPALWAQGVPGVAFRDVSVLFPLETAPPKLAPRMETDALMITYGWASAAGEWRAEDGAAGKEYWNTGEFYGDGSLEFQWKRAAANGKLELALRADRGKFDSGYVVRCEDKGDNNLHLALLRAGQTVKERQFTLKPAGGAKMEQFPVRVSLEGRALLLTVAGHPALSYIVAGKKTTDGDAAAVGAQRGTGDGLAGTAIAARATGFTLDPKDLRALSSHRYDYTFTDAPTDWYAPQGDWGVSSRWPCTAAWSFFGGRGTMPVLWHKRTFKGDTIVEAYVHNMMDQATPPYYTKVGNLNITIGGDGKNPTSGYSFIYAGWHNTKAAIMRGTQLVAENKTDKAYYDSPVIKPGYIFHRGWQYIRAEVRRATQKGQSGVLVSFAVDNNKLGEYFDATPLPSYKQGGRVAFWTCNSTISIARVKIESADHTPLSLPDGLLDTSVPETTRPEAAHIEVGKQYLIPRPVKDSDSLPTAIIEKGADTATNDAVWTVRNPAAGGLFEVKLFKSDENPAKATPWHASPKTHLSADLGLGPETKVDIYLTIDGQRHMINLSGIKKSESGKTDGDIRDLGETASAVEVEVGTAGSAADLKNLRLDPDPRLNSSKATDTPDTHWRHVDFDLGAALHKLYPSANTWTISDIAVGALHGEDYRWAGFDGNPLGATYRLRNVQLTDEG